MSLKKSFIFLALTSAALCSGQAAAQMTSEKGMANITFSGRTPSAPDRQAAMRKAELNALDRYIAEGDPARSNIFEHHRTEIASHIDDYILGTTSLSETSDKESKTYTLVVRADINTNRLINDLGTGSAWGATSSTGHGLVSFLFVARTQSRVQQFDPRVTQRSVADRSQDRSTHEGESVHARSVGTSEGSQTRSSQTVTTGGSTLLQADKISWSISNAGEIDTSMTGIFSDAGYQVIEADQVEGASGGMVNIARIQTAYSQGNDLPSSLMYSTTQGAERAGIDYLALGTMDVGMPDRDPVSGNVRVFVVVTGKVMYVKGRFARTVASVGPVQYAGLGPDASVARINALKSAANQAAKQLVDTLASKSIH